MAQLTWHQRQRRERLFGWGLPLATFALLAAVWQAATTNLESLIIPTFTAAMAGLLELTVLGGELWQPLLVSNQSLVLGYLISVLVAVPLGLGMARSKLLEGVAEPYVYIVLAMPTAPLIPLIMMALGLGLASQVLIVFLFTFVYIMVNTRAGVRNVDPVLIEMARSFGATERQLWRKILIPGALPALLTGLRIGLGRAVNGMVAAELLLVATGIGNLLLEYRAAFKGGLLFAAVFAIALEAILLLTLMRLLEDWLAPWAAGGVGD